MTLALLLTAVTGAWADETLLLTIESKDYQSFTSGSMTFDDKVTVTFSNEVYNDGDQDGWYGGVSLLTVAGTNGYTITSCKFYTNLGTAANGYTVEGESPSVYLSGGHVYTDDSKSVFLGNVGITKIEVYGGVASAAEPDVKVTTNAAEEGATFTEASFTMPQNDVTVTYTLKRDMAVDMAVTVQDAQQNSRFRVQKQGNNFVPVGLNMQQVLALFNVHDDIENTDLTLQQDYYGLIFSLDDDDQPTGDGVLLANFNFAPGRYAVRAIGQEGSNYVGTTEQSNVFTLYQGYEVEVAAKEFITYYKDEPLYVEDEAAELYTIESVNGDQAVLSDRSDAMPSNTPMLVYNKSNETKVILLIPCAEPDMAITVAPEFQGTLTGTTIAASTENQTNYAFNGKAFVFVKNAIEVGPNKAWLSISNSNARAINLVFDETTKIANTNITNITNGDWYDLNGRKLDKMPTKKGVYIMNGKKVVVK